MSVEQNMSNNKIVNANNEERVVIDAIHERFRPNYVRCEDCNSNIAWDEEAIKKHYNSLHPSNRYCRYCEGKVFMYRKITPADDDEIPYKLSQEIIYHKCEHKEQTKTSE